MKAKESQPGQAFLRFIRSIAVNRAQTKHSARDRMLANSHAGRGTRLPPTWKLARSVNTRGILIIFLGSNPAGELMTSGLPHSTRTPTSLVFNQWITTFVSFPGSPACDHSRPDHAWLKLERFRFDMGRTRKDKVRNVM